MKFTIADDHQDYFQENHRIEFEGFLTEEDIYNLKQEIESVIAERLQASQEKVLQRPPYKLFEAGRDLWRNSDEIRKTSCRRTFGEVVFLLTGQKPLRLGYDQFFPALKSSVFPVQDTYSKWLQTPSTLKEVSCVQDVVCGVLLCLTGDTTSGNVIFLAPEAPIDFLETLDLREHSYYLIVYTKAKSVYIHNKLDPHFPDLLQWGYNFGDRLKDELNPIIFR